MDVHTAIDKRRSYRALEPFEVTEKLITELASAASLSASCYNKQPWRFVFVYAPDILGNLHQALAEGNTWAKRSSMIVAVCSKKEFDCITSGREYYQFDTGMAAAHMMLRATELHLVTHAMAGYNEQKVKDVLLIPQDIRVLALIAIGKHASDYEHYLTDWQLDVERNRPARLALNQFAYKNRYVDASED